MNLKCKINGKEYLLSQGVTFSEEYNETLDSATIIISQIPKIEDIQPYDDVYIYDNEFDGYGRQKEEFKDSIYITENNSNKYLELKIPNYFVESYLNYKAFEKKIRFTLYKKDENDKDIAVICEAFISNEDDRYYFNIPALSRKNEIVLDTNNFWVLSIGKLFLKDYYLLTVNDFYIETNNEEHKKNNNFYKHLLIQSINREELNFDERLYKYTILLFSETKRLETIQLPNFSITQPLDINLKRSIYDYMVDIVDMYSPLYKVVDNETQKTWKYVKKYRIDPKLEIIFGNVYSPDFTLNNPNLRDVLSQLMIVKDMIPYVEDDVIKGLDITQRTGEFDINYDHINYVYSNLTSDNYCNSLKRTYSDALSQDRSCRLTEFLSFRNSDNALLTIENMKLETTYPIYKINKMYMCYYKKFNILDVNSTNVTTKMFLCKQDISKLVKLNSERNVLSEDWSEFNYSTIESVDDLAKFKIGTIGYDIGSKNISGWGGKYTHYLLFNWFPKTDTYVGKLLEFMDLLYPYGIYNYSYLKDKSKIQAGEYIQVIDAIEKETRKEKGLVSPFVNDYPLGLKGLFFEVNYDAFYNGTIYHSKDNSNRDDIVINDNSSSSLTLLEQDGIAQKEKINRFGNEVFQINARYNDINQLQPLGSVYDSEKNADNDVVIYSREYSIYDNVINCKYVGAKDYVLKNYFTSVYAKHRPYNLMSYDESVYRAENKKVFLLFDLEKKYIEKNNDILNFKNFQNDINSAIDSSFLNCLTKILSFIKETVISHKNNFKNTDKINYGFIEFKGIKYASDVNVFVSGDSLCFNLKMYDNVSAGVYINVNNLEPLTTLSDFTSIKDDAKGSLQDWYLIVDSEKTGFSEKIGFYICHIDENNYIEDGVIDSEDKINGMTLKTVKWLERTGNEENQDINLIDKQINVLKDDSIYKKIFELPRINVEDTLNFKNLIGNEFLLKKDNKELIDMTFQIEPITMSDKILFSPWLMKLSDLNGNYNKVFSETYVANSQGNSFEDFEIKTIETSRFMVYENIHNEFRSSYFPTMIIEIPEENVNESVSGGSVINLESVLSKYPFVETSISFVYKTLPDVFFNPTGDNGYSVQSLFLNFNKITAYDKENGFIELEGEQLLEWKEHKSWDFGIPKDKEGTNKVKMRFKMTDRIELTTATVDKHYLEAPSGKKWFVYDTFVDRLQIPNIKNYPIVYTALADGGKNMIYSNNPDDFVLNTENSNTYVTYISATNDFGYLKNMFVSSSSEKMKKHQVYNQYKNLEEIGLSSEETGPLVNEIFTFESDDVLRINLQKFDKNKTKSIQLWYKNGIIDTNSQEMGVQEVQGSLNFVFGVNVDEEDFDRGYLDIFISLITHKDMRVFDSKHNEIGQVKNVANSTDIQDLINQKYEKYIDK